MKRNLIVLLTILVCSLTACKPGQKKEDIKKKEIMNILEKFLSDLKAGDRDIFVRRYWYMDNIKDIAKRHGCSETKIKSSLFRSRNKLWEEVKEII